MVWKFTMSANIIEIRIIRMLPKCNTNESKKCYVDIPIDALPILDEYLQINVFKWSMWSPNLSKAIKYALPSKEEKRSTYDADFEVYNFVRNI